MSDGITLANLYARCENLNRRHENLGTRVRYSVQGRNGYIGLDRYDVDGSMIENMRCGTKREIGEFLHAMMVALDDAELFSK